MKDDRHESSRRDAPMVAVWTPWGEQRVPRADGRMASLRRMVQRLRDAKAARKQKTPLN